MDAKVLFDLFRHLSDYMSSFCIAYVTSRSIIINFEFLSYDLVDKNLDFDEAYYSQLRKNITDMILFECKKLCAEHSQTIDIFQSLKSMQNYTVLENKYTVVNESVTTTTYNRMCF